MFATKQKAGQGEFWVAAHQLPQSAKSTFYAKLDETLSSFGFADKVRAAYAPAYKSGNAGRPGIDPVVYLKMIMVGFFEDLPSERAIAARCADSMSIRAFLNYSLEEKTPDHSSFTVIRQRLGLEVLLAVVAVIIGGRESFVGPVLAGFLLGVMRASVGWYASTRWQDTVTYLLLVLFLFLRPQGIIGKKMRLEAQA